MSRSVKNRKGQIFRRYKRYSRKHFAASFQTNLSFFFFFLLFKQELEGELDGVQGMVAGWVGGPVMAKRCTSLSRPWPAGVIIHDPAWRNSRLNEKAIRL